MIASFWEKTRICWIIETVVFSWAPEYPT